MGRKNITFSLGDVSHRVSESIGRDVDKTWCSFHLKEIDAPVNTSYSRNKRFTAEQCTLLSAYAQEYYHKKHAPAFVQWLDTHGHGVPSPFCPPVRTVQVKKEKGGSISTRDVERMVKDAVKRELQKHTKPVKMIEGSRQPNREKRLSTLHKKVNNFVFTHKIEISEAWKWLAELFAKRNGIDKIRRTANQSFPQWLEGSDNLDLMYEQLDGYLDYMDDQLVNGPGLAL